MALCRFCEWTESSDGLLRRRSDRCTELTARWGVHALLEQRPQF